jgi:hypothetical protein
MRTANEVAANRPVIGRCSETHSRPINISNNSNKGLLSLWIKNQ